MKTTGSLRAALAFTLALTCAAGAVRAQVASYPDRPIKLLVGFGAGDPSSGRNTCTAEEVPLMEALTVSVAVTV